MNASLSELVGIVPASIKFDLKPATPVDAYQDAVPDKQARFVAVAFGAARSSRS